MINRENYSRYGPPESDSEDDELEGYSFGDKFEIEKNKFNFTIIEQCENELITAIKNNDLDKLKNKINTLNNFDINEPQKNDMTLLQLSCSLGNLEITKFLVNELNANVNRSVNSMTPLMEICLYRNLCYNDLLENVNKKTDQNNIDYDNNLKVLEIVKFLISKGAIINIGNKYGITPLMYACMSGHTRVVDFLINHNVSLEALDNKGCNALFYAVENNHPECVKLLLDKNIDINVVNHENYTAKEIAEYKNFKNIADLFPSNAPLNNNLALYFSNNTLDSTIPQIFRDKKKKLKKLIDECYDYNGDINYCSEYFIKEDDNDNSNSDVQIDYFYDVHQILLENRMDKYLDNFFEKRISLHEFLTINSEDKLKEFGIQYSVHRKKILLEILRYHLSHCEKSSVSVVSKTKNESSLDHLSILGNHLKHLVIINSSLEYIKENLKYKYFGNVSPQTADSFKKSLQNYKRDLIQLEKTFKYLHKFSPKTSPMYINFNSYLKQKRNRQIKRVLFFSTIIAVPFIIYFKIRK